MAISIFTPKGQKFFSLFNKMADTIEQMHQTYAKFIQSQEETVLLTILSEIQDLRQASHTTAHQVFIELGKNFITPLDREDIYALASSLDGISDYIYALARQRMNYRLIELPEYSFVLTQRLQLALAELQAIINKLSDTSNVEKLAGPCKQMKGILDTCFRITDNAKADVMQNSNDILEIVKLVDHFEYSAILIGKCKDAGKTIDNIIIKYS